MSIAWIAPAALLGLVLIVLPIAIHLLVRQPARTLAYPSLRFLRETQLAALRRRTIQDAPLLLCRAAIIALAAVALAGPVLQTLTRTAGYAGRTSRAMVALDGAEGDLVARIADGAFASAAFRRSTIADSLTDAVRWLDRQPPSSREIVIAGALRRGSVSDADLTIVPNDIGLRFDAVAADQPNDVTWSVLARRNGSLVRIDRALHFDTDATRVTDGQTASVPEDLIAIVARPEDTPLAGAALRAVLEAGVPWSDFDRRTVVAWEGGDADAVTRAKPGARTIRMPVPAPPSAAADAVLAALSDASPDPDRLEPVMIAPEQLSAWSRSPGSPAIHLPLADEGDRRWLWAMVLVLLAVETWMRRRRADSATVVAGNPEARVA